MRLDRRGWTLAAGVAAVAAGAGLGWALWRPRGATVGMEAGAVDELWSSSYDAPSGGQLVMAPMRGQPLVLNFWATWCPPCIREMPTLDRFQRDYAAHHWRVVGLAADKAEPVREFLVRTPVSYAIGLTGFAGVDLARRLGNVSGGLPFTVLLRRDGSIASGRFCRLNIEAMEQALQPLLATSP